MARAIVSTISASSGGLKNYYENPKAEADVTTGVTITVETTNQIEDDVSYLVTQDNSGSNADVRFAIVDIDQYVTDEAFIIRSGAYIRTDAADAPGDVTFGIWNDTDGAWMHGPEPLTGGGDLNIVSTLLAAPLEAGKVYQGRLLRTDSTDGREMIVDKLELSPDNGGAILTEAEADSPGIVKSYEEGSIQLDSGFSGGSIRYTRVGSMVTIASNQLFLNSPATGHQTSDGLIPVNLRPPSTVQGGIAQNNDTVTVSSLYVTANGAVGVNHWSSTNTATSSSRGGTMPTMMTISYSLAD
jgi:hypothetical protein